MNGNHGWTTPQRCGACTFAAAVTIVLDVWFHGRPVSYDMAAHVASRISLALIIEHVLIWKKTRQVCEICYISEQFFFNLCVTLVAKIL